MFRPASLRPVTYSHQSVEETSDDDAEDFTDGQSPQDDIPHPAKSPDQSIDGTFDDDVQFITEAQFEQERSSYRLPRQRKTESRSISANLSSEFSGSTTASRAASRESNVSATKQLFHSRIGSSASGTEHRILTSRSSSQQQTRGQEPSGPRRREDSAPFEDFLVRDKRTSTNQRELTPARSSQQVHRQHLFNDKGTTTGPRNQASVQVIGELQDATGGIQLAMKSKLLPPGTTLSTVLAELKGSQVNAASSNRFAKQQETNKAEHNIPSKAEDTVRTVVLAQATGFNGSDHQTVYMKSVEKPTGGRPRLLEQERMQAPTPSLP